MSRTIVNVRVTPKAKQAQVKVEDIDGLRVLKIYVTVAPEGGKANRAVMRVLSDYFDVPRTRIKLLSGATHRDKRFVIDAEITV
ncbi:MAG: DUF167 domain-containing protein [Halieaceae bacterium]|nr:DUF167 domain-containing protein [Halieaceae bacterium]